jgi:hypothetical protein
MKISVLNKEETYRIRHVTLNIEAQEGGKTYKMNVTIIENYDSHHKSYSYEVESINWLTDIKGLDTDRIEDVIEGYLIDNAEDILA